MTANRKFRMANNSYDTNNIALHQEDVAIAEGYGSFVDL